MSDTNLPPLPEDCRHSYAAAYSADQMREYAQRAVMQERERCLAAASGLRRRLRGTSRQLASELEARILSGVLT